MTIQEYETAIATFRQVLAGAAPEQITCTTPCASFDVGQLINHTIGTQHMVTDAPRDKPFNMTGVELARGEQAAAFDRAAADAVAELHREGAMGKEVNLPFGNFGQEADGPGGDGHVPARVGLGQGHRAGHRPRCGARRVPDGLGSRAHGPRLARRGTGPVRAGANRPGRSASRRSTGGVSRSRRLTRRLRCVRPSRRTRHRQPP